MSQGTWGPPALTLVAVAVLWELVLGFGMAVVVGIPLAMAIVYSPTLARTLYPLMVASQSVPKIAIAPLLIFWAGIGTLPKVLVAFLISFFPIIIDTVAGLRSVEPEMLHLARSMGAGEMKIFLKIRFPTALPNLFAGLKVAVTLAVVVAVLASYPGRASAVAVTVVFTMAFRPAAKYPVDFIKQVSAFAKEIIQLLWGSGR